MFVLSVHTYVKRSAGSKERMKSYIFFTKTLKEMQDLQTYSRLSGDAARLFSEDDYLNILVAPGKICKRLKPRELLTLHSGLASGSQGAEVSSSDSEGSLDEETRFGQLLEKKENKKT